MNICVFAGSNFGNRIEYRIATESLGKVLADKEIGLVYGGASVGLMGALADAVLSHGGSAIGVMPQSIANVKIAHNGLTELRVVSSMHERKAQMADLSDGFVVLPGGIGSLEESFEVWTWSQLGIHSKPIGLLNVDGFYDGLEMFLDHLVVEGFVKPVHRQILLSDSDPVRLIDLIIGAELPKIGKWIDP
jgi:uncharacterized protein (TIGR00730 family)